MSTELLNLFSKLDDAYNSRDWQTYSDLFDDSFQGFNAKGGTAENKTDHVENAKRFCGVFQDAAVHHSPYPVAVSDGEWTCTMARTTGKMTEDFRGPAGRVIPATHQEFDLLLATFARWQAGKIVEEYSFLDQAELLRQVGITGL